jgi:hypothetical protein
MRTHYSVVVLDINSVPVCNKSLQAQEPQAMHAMSQVPLLGTLQAADRSCKPQEALA